MQIKPKSQFTYFTNHFSELSKIFKKDEHLKEHDIMIFMDVILLSQIKYNLLLKIGFNLKIQNFVHIKFESKKF